MSKKPAVHFRALIGCMVGVAFLGACAGPEQDGAEQANRQVVVSQEQDLRDVTVLLSVGKAAVSLSESASVTVTLRNDGRHAVKMLRWFTPADGLEEPLFEVTRDGMKVAFEGPHYKRPAATEADYVRLAPGESLTRTVDLQGVYDLSKSGTYRVRFSLGEGSNAVRQLASNEVSLFIEGRANPMLADKDVSASVTSAITFTGRCDATQQSTLLQAMNAASAMADNSNTYLSTTTPGATARYVTWFGAYSSTNWNTAKTHFVAIKDAFDTKAVTLDCSCKKSYYAYVYPTQPYKIYVCSAFWSAPMTGTDSKGGTLIHEMSHFNVVVGTDDHVYGQSGAKSLAISNPTNALDNADNHEYFAENTPFLQ